MDIARIKRDCSDFTKTSRWAEVKSDVDPGRTTNYRIVGIGRTNVRVMSAAGTIFSVSPADIRRAW